MENPVLVKESENLPGISVVKDESIEDDWCDLGEQHYNQLEESEFMADATVYESLKSTEDEPVIVLAVSGEQSKVSTSEVEKELESDPGMTCEIDKQPEEEALQNTQISVKASPSIEDLIQELNIKLEEPPKRVPESSSKIESKRQDNVPPLLASQGVVLRIPKKSVASQIQDTLLNCFGRKLASCLSSLRKIKSPDTIYGLHIDEVDLNLTGCRRRKTRVGGIKIL